MAILNGTPLGALVTHSAFVTGVIRDYKAPNTFLRQLLFPSANDKIISSNSIEWGVSSSGRTTAYFTALDAQAKELPNRSTDFVAVSAPYINQSKGFTGMQIMKEDPFYWQNPYGPTLEETRRRAREWINYELKELVETITNTEEWMAAQCLRGEIAIAATEGPPGVYNTGRPNGHSFTASTLWSDANAKPIDNLRACARILSADFGGPDIIIMNSAVADVFVNHPNVVNKMDMIRFDSGSIDLTKGFDNSGIRAIGRIEGVPIVEYNRKVTLRGANTEQSLIRTDYVEVINVNAFRQWNLFQYAIIPDLYLPKFRGIPQGKTFTRIIEEESPAGVRYEVASRPFPVVREPKATVSMKVV